MAKVPGPVGDGVWWAEDLSATFYNPALPADTKVVSLGQTANTVAGTVANQTPNTVPVPALAAGASGTVTITNTLITTLSMVKVLGFRIGTTTPDVNADVRDRYFNAPAAGSIVLNVVNKGSAASLSTDYQLWYEVMN